MQLRTNLSAQAHEVCVSLIRKFGGPEDPSISQVQDFHDRLLRDLDAFTPYLEACVDPIARNNVAAVFKK